MFPYQTGIWKFLLATASLLPSDVLWYCAYHLILQLTPFNCSCSLFHSFLFLLFLLPLLSWIFCLMLIMQLIPTVLTLDFSASSSATSSSILSILPVPVLLLLFLLLLLFFCFFSSVYWQPIGKSTRLSNSQKVLLPIFVI